MKTSMTELLDRSRGLSRREALKQFALIAGGLTAGCTPVRMALGTYSHELEKDSAAMDRVLRAFVTTVIPEAPFDEPNLVRAVGDPYYHFAPYRTYLRSRSHRSPVVARWC